MNNKKKLNVILVLIIFILATNTVLAFDITSSDLEKNVCPSNTALFTATVSGTGSFNVNYEGSAAVFATVVPQGFTLNNEQKNIFTYITPKQGTAPGVYNLNLIVTSGEKKSINYKVNINNCNQVSITGTPNKEFCACNQETYEYNVLNSGDYEENYKLDVTGTGKEYVTLSEQQFKLRSKESKKIVVYYNAPCGTKGDYDFNLNVISTTSTATANFNSKAKISSCYDFSLVPSKTFIGMCEHTIESVPLSIENTADSENEFSLFLAGPAFANLEKDSLVLKAKEKRDFNLVLNPDYKVEGDYNVNIKIKDKQGKTDKEQLIKVNVRACNDVIVNIEKKEDKVCNVNGKEYSVNIKNSGEFEKEFKIEANYPWVTLDKQVVRLKPNGEENIKLKIVQTKDLTGEYEIKVKATALDSSKFSSEAILKASLLDIKNCFIPKIDAKDLSLKPDTTSTLEVKITNNGVEKADYILSLTGKAARFVQLNPSTLSVDSGKTETSYLYIAPPFNTDLGAYDAIINVKVSGSDTLDTKTLNIEVVKEGGVGEKKEIIIQNKTSQKGFFDKILDWIKKNLSADIKEEKIATINISENNVITNDVKFDFKNYEYQIRIKEIKNDSVAIEVGSEPFMLNKNKAEKIDLDKDNYYDLELKLEEVRTDKAILKSKPIKEKVSNIEDIKKEGKDYSGMILNFLIVYKFYIILGLVILIVIILIMNYWKEIIDFFEEESEEEEKSYRKKR